MLDLDPECLRIENVDTVAMSTPHSLVGDNS